MLARCAALALCRRGLRTTRPVLAGHAKWQNVQYKKERGEAKKSQESTKARMYITSAIRQGGGETDSKLNSALASAISLAKSKMVPRAVIDKAIAGFSTSAAVSELVFEMLAPQGVSFVAVSLTENTLRTTPMLKAALRKYDIKFTTGSVLYRFPKRGIIVLDAAALPGETDPLEVALEIGAENMEEAPDGPDGEERYELHTDPADVGAVVEALKDKYGLAPLSFDIGYVPESRVEVPVDERAVVQEIVEAIEDAESIVKVFHDAA